MRTVCVLPGDGIGPEVVACATRVLGAVTDDLELVEAGIGLGEFKRAGSYLTEDTLELMMSVDSCLFGAVTSVSDPSYDSPVLKFRKELDLYANIRPVRDIVGLSGRAVDLIIVRENSEGLYTGQEDEDDAGVTTMRRVSRRASDRIVRHSISVAKERNRRHICCVHKANVLRRSDGLFLGTFNGLMAKESDWLSSSDQLVDSAAARLVRNPESFDVMVTLNLYGDILSDVAAGVVGGLGFAPSGNIGPDHSVFEPAHGSAPDIAGKGVANPSAAILAAAMMLRHLGMKEEGIKVEEALCSAYRDGIRTVDVGGDLGSEGFTDTLVRRL
jgi:isopropylmalate/isohomocitrate dehydrogenase-like protein